ncbi:hypothetical protein OCV46_15550 [Anthropogastromicrobium aceti]|nr:hypothetical protein [uncultured Blautia sp.]MCU6785317.1 hypothetical protein [Anthropogastromicrobium aceti]
MNNQAKGTLSKDSVPFCILRRSFKEVVAFFYARRKGGAAGMYFTEGKQRAFELLMQQKPGFDRYQSGCARGNEDCGTCRFYRPQWKYEFCVFKECPYCHGKRTRKTTTSMDK